MLRVDRGAFVPAAAAAQAYADAPVVLQVDPEGRPVSTVSQPTMVALMLEQLEVRPGGRVLEIGTASGYNAALLAALVGDGHVVTVELDDELAELAAGRLRDTPNVTVITGDGRHGHLARAPYDGIIVTAGAPAVAPAWKDQLAAGGRLVVPLDVVGEGAVCVTFEEVAGALVERTRTPCRFVPLRGSSPPEP